MGLLTMTRKAGQTVKVGETVELTVVETLHNGAHLSIAGQFALTLLLEQKLVIHDTIEVWISDSSAGRVNLSIRAPSDVLIVRGELLTRSPEKHTMQHPRASLDAGLQDGASRGSKEGVEVL